MLNIIDGFLYNTLLRPNLTYLALCLERYDALRGAGNFRSRTWVIPTSGQIAIPANDSYEYQTDVAPGSVIWGWTWAGGTGFAFQVTDGCNDVALQIEVQSTDISQGVNALYNAGVNPGQGKQNPLSRPLVIGPPGLLNVVICNLNATDAPNTQLILWGGEPFEEGKC